MQACDPVVGPPSHPASAAASGAAEQLGRQGVPVVSADALQATGA
jgi:hypothetical protein